MTIKDFTQLYPEIKNPKKTLHDLRELCRYKKYEVDNLIFTLHDFHLNRFRYKGYLENPEVYLWKIISNSIKKHFNGQISKHTEEIKEIAQEIEEQDFFELKSTKEKLNDFNREMRRANFPKSQLELIELMLNLCEKPHQTYKCFMEEVQDEAYQRGISHSNFRKILERLRAKASGNDDIKGTLLSFISADKLRTLEFIEFLLSLTKHERIPLKAYRFSKEELKKMLWLEDLFAKNGFTFERFPEVYSDTYERACDVLPELRNSKFEEDTPDALAYYCPDYTQVKCNENCETLIVNEGFIVLFEDKILDFAQRINLSLEIGVNSINNALREVVLYHELGHWFSHWPERGGENWGCRFYFNFSTNTADTKTHESLAQIIAYWAVKGNALNEKILAEYLTPKRPDSAYREYLDLTKIPASEILNKLVLLRKHMGCNALLDDELGCKLLKIECDIYSELAKFAYEHSIRKVGLNVDELKQLESSLIIRILLKFNELLCKKNERTSEYEIALMKVEDEVGLDENSKNILRYYEPYMSTLKRLKQ